MAIYLSKHAVINDSITLAYPTNFIFSMLSKEVNVAFEKNKLSWSYSKQQNREESEGHAILFR